MGEVAAMVAVVMRPLNAGDIDAISRIHAESCRIAYRFMNWDYSLEEVRQWYQEERFPQWDWGAVSEQNGEVLGFIAMSRGHIDQLFVRPERQRIGVGTSLLEAALARGIRPATLHVFEPNLPARRLYARHGFAEVERWLNEQEDAVELLLRLD
jgi:ribosomal protein S18 acetylase RimI-like enzyme